MHAHDIRVKNDVPFSIGGLRNVVTLPDLPHIEKMVELMEEKPLASESFYTHLKMFDSQVLYKIKDIACMVAWVLTQGGLAQKPNGVTNKIVFDDGTVRTITKGISGVLSALNLSKMMIPDLNS